MGLTTPAYAESVSAAAVGDMQCKAIDLGNCPDNETATMINGFSPANLLSLGDQVQGETPIEYTTNFAPIWGSWGASIYPVIGNHEYYGAASPGGYESYFGSRVNTNSLYNYSFDLGVWHFVVLNSNCEEVSCSYNSAQFNWVKADLDQHLTGCTAVLMHHPVWSSSETRLSNFGTFANMMDNRNVDLLLNGHAHLYERMAKIGQGGDLDSHGIREFTIGTASYPTQNPNNQAPESKKLIKFTKGAAFFNFDSDYYDWKFRNNAGTILDSGFDDCD
jgi:hypothetical protein